MAGKIYGNAPNTKPITGNEQNEGLDGRRPDGDDAANAANKSKELGGNNSGRAAGKRPG